MNTNSTIKQTALVMGLLFATSAIAQFTQQSKIVSPDRESRDEFGTATDIRGDFAISGTPRYNIAAGAAYIYAKDADGDWSHHQSLIPDDSQEMAEFGGGVKMMEDYIVVASGRADIDQANRAGALYVYDQNGSAWDFNTKIIASDYSDGSMMGMNHTSLDAEGDIIVAGAPGENAWVGSVYIFERIDDTWTEVQKIESPDPLTMSSFGIGVSLSGDTMVVGANEANELRGTAYIYTKDASGLWVLEQQISAADSMPEDFFGTSVSMDGETILVGAYGSNGVSGSAYVFKKDDMNVWGEVQTLTASVPFPEAHFGWQCEVKGTSLVVGAPHAWASTKGEVFLFEENATGDWEEIQIIQSNDIEAENFFGWSVALYENQIIAGAPWEGTDENGENPLGQAGSVYIFKNPSLGTPDFNDMVNTLQCFPNPTDNIFTIKSSNKTIENIQLYGINGILIQESNAVNNKTSSLDTQSHAKGIYLVHIYFEDGSYAIQKMIKQ